MKRAYIEAWASDDYGNSPQFAVLEVSDEFLLRLKELQKICIDHKLSNVSDYQSPNAWGSGDIGDELRLHGDALVVTDTAFWFLSWAKCSDCQIETRVQDIDDFLNRVGNGLDGHIFFGSNEEDLKEIVAGSEDGESCDD